MLRTDSISPRDDYAQPVHHSAMTHSERVGWGSDLASDLAMADFEDTAFIWK